MVIDQQFQEVFAIMIKVIFPLFYKDIELFLLVDIVLLFRHFYEDFLDFLRHLLQNGVINRRSRDQLAAEVQFWKAKPVLEFFVAEL